MDARDIRVGNLIYFRDSLVVAGGRDIWKIEDVIGDYKPIPLTPTRAESLGFKYLKSSRRKNTRTWYLNHFFIYFGKAKGPKMNNNFPLPYVHNLQNMYWERYKQELKFY